MELIIGIVVIWVIITVIKALKNADNLPSMDESGNMRCKGCGSSSFKHTQIMTALTPMNAIIAASGGQDTNVISSQKATRQVFFVVWLFFFDFRRRSYCFRFVYENNAGGLL